MKAVSLVVSAVIACSSQTAAYVYPNGVTAMGSGSPISQDENATLYDYFVKANTNPNDTRSVSFLPPHVYESSSDNPHAIDGSTQWIWRVNITDVPVPDARPEHPSEQSGFVDPHIVNTAYDLSWPEGANISEALNGTNASVCATILTGLTFPNVTNLYAENDTDSSSCEPVLGSDCISAIFGSVTSYGGTCQLGQRPWFDLPECASTLGATTGIAPYNIGTVQFLLNSATASMNETSSPSKFRNDPFNDRSPSGTAFFAESSSVHNGTNTTLYDQAVNQFRMVMLTVVPQDNRGVVSKLAMCMRVKTSELPSNTTNGDGSPIIGTSSETTSPGVAAGLGVNTAGLISGVGGLAALFAML